MTAPERNELRRRIDEEKRRRIQARCNGETGRFYDNPDAGGNLSGPVPAPGRAMSAAELELEREGGFAFYRLERRKTRLKRLCDCGHWIDGTEPYRYQVFRLLADPRGVIRQRLDCEFCAREDNAY